MSRPHGTVTNYSNHGCRCKPCSLAYSDYRKSRYPLNREAILAQKREYGRVRKVEISIRNQKWRENNREFLREQARERYLSNREAALDRQKEYEPSSTARYTRSNNRSRDSATKLWVKWTPEEDAQCMDYSRTAKQIAYRLGRTIESVKCRRRKLKAAQNV